MVEFHLCNLGETWDIYVAPATFILCDFGSHSNSKLVNSNILKHTKYRKDNHNDSRLISIKIRRS
uniref:Uncharacterized protein n=1 Tax=Physcomitrium patens TaxID=3218 RepID=A0A2K1LBL0_PHYPA|nr:hypothetical protein PHYPA_001833 [Physcomitrium patens]